MSVHRMTTASFRLSHKNLGILPEFFGQMVHRPPGKEPSKYPLSTLLDEQRSEEFTFFCSVPFAFKLLCCVVIAM